MKVFSTIFAVLFFLGASATVAKADNDAASGALLRGNDAGRELGGHKTVPVCKPHGDVNPETGLARNYVLKYVGKWVGYYLIHVLSIRGPGKKIHGAPGYWFDDNCQPVFIEE